MIIVHLRTILGVLILATIASAANAQGIAEGGIVNRDRVSAYLSSTGDRTRDTELPRGTIVVGLTSTFGIATAFQFTESDGRIKATYVLPGDGGEQISIMRDAWFDKSDLTIFTYECGCPSTMDKNVCYPFVNAGFTTAKYSVCVKASASKKLAELRPQWEKELTPAATAPRDASQERDLSNADVLAMHKAGLSDELVVAKIQSSPRESLDVSVDTLIRLRQDGLASVILDAMVKRVAQRR